MHPSAALPIRSKFNTLTNKVVFYIVKFNQGQKQRKNIIFIIIEIIISMSICVS